MGGHVLQRVVSLAGGGVAASYSTAQDGSLHPLLVCVHGGGYTGKYFDVPGASLVERGVASGFDVLAVDRPGHGGSPGLVPGPELFRRNADLLREALDDFLDGRDNAQAVVIGHSIGGAIAVILAAGRPAWLRSIAISGVGIRPYAAMARVFRPIQGVVHRVSLPMRFKESKMFGEPGSYDTALAETSLAVASAPALTAELVDIVYWWRGHMRPAAELVTVPVHYRIADHDPLWNCRQVDVTDFASLFTNSPEIDASLVLNSGHCIDHHRVGEAFHASQLDFASRSLN